MAKVYKRLLTIPNYSFFLFGPRGTGKTTCLREHLPAALWFNLLTNTDYLPIISDPEFFRKRVLAQESGGWIVVDEVQKAPSVLNEIHDLLSLHGKKYLFALSGSSARKLKNSEANLLAGRALDLRFFPLTSAELASDFHLDTVLQYGSLPAVWNEKDLRAEILEAYVGTYLREEIQQQALVENLEAFSRFLRVAALMNGNVMEYASTGRDCGVARKTVERYFQILADTLICHSVPAWQPRMKVKEYSKPKIYFFDTGVVRSLSGRIRAPLHDLERGLLLETFLINEIKAASSYLGLGYDLSHYRSEAGESDIIISTGSGVVGVEIKSSTNWKRGFGVGLNLMLRNRKIQRAYGVYRGHHELRDNGILVFPVERFLGALWSRRV
jgi:predicted AAA+ superfamily ATPase